MNNNFNLKQYLSKNKLLQEIRINKPLPKFKSNLELRSYFEKNPEHFKEILKDINPYGPQDYDDDNGPFDSLSFIKTKKEEEEDHTNFLEQNPNFIDRDMTEYSSYNKQNPELSLWDEYQNHILISTEPLQIKYDTRHTNRHQRDDSNYIKSKEKQIKLGANTLYYTFQ